MEFCFIRGTYTHFGVFNFYLLTLIWIFERLSRLLPFAIFRRLLPYFAVFQVIGSTRSDVGHCESNKNQATLDFCA